MRQYTTSEGTTALLKDESVDMEGAHAPSVDPIIDAAGPLYAPTEQALVITSAADGTHSEGSLHYPESGRFEGGQALDLRIWHLPDPAQVAKELQQKLGPQYDVVYHEPGHDTHIHVERDV